jgi:hypothetical protein
MNPKYVLDTNKRLWIYYENLNIYYKSGEHMDTGITLDILNENYGPLFELTMRDVVDVSKPIANDTLVDIDVGDIGKLPGIVENYDSKRNTYIIAVEIGANRVNK